jgi:adenylate cyclase
MARRLAAILAADVVGYSRLMSADEAGTLAAVKACLDGVIAPAVAGHEGRVVKLMGDGLLAEFASAVEAVAAAADIQKAMSAREPGRPDDTRLRWRIGINLGDIIAEDGDIHGDGVNIAARLEGLAEPGGISIARSVHEQVKGKLELAFEDLGAQAVKNIPEPLHVFRVVLENEGGAAPREAFEAEIGLDFSIPETPSIAVLPFTVMADDPEQDFFADGVAEDIITALSKIRAGRST